MGFFELVNVVFAVRADGLSLWWSQQALGHQCFWRDQNSFWSRICTKVGRGQELWDKVQSHRTNSSKSFSETGRKVL